MDVLYGMVGAFRLPDGSFGEGRAGVTAKVSTTGRGEPPADWQLVSPSVNSMATIKNIRIPCKVSFSLIFIIPGWSKFTLPHPYESVIIQYAAIKANAIFMTGDPFLELIYILAASCRWCWSRCGFRDLTRGSINGQLPWILSKMAAITEYFVLDAVGDDGRGSRTTSAHLG